jgi:hypothetical protein
MAIRATFEIVHDRFKTNVIVRNGTRAADHLQDVSGVILANDDWDHPESRHTCLQLSKRDRSTRYSNATRSFDMTIVI